MLSISQLRQYESWIGRSADEIRRTAIARGGWAQIFPGNKRFPLWASKVRNYFNIRPKRFKLLGVKERSRAKSRAGLTVNALASKGFVEALAFSGDVYIDEAGRHWFEMSTAGTIYHYKGQVSDAGWYKKWEAFVSRQKSTPVFKLISPDSTGGSLEVCIHNWQSSGGKSQIGPEGKWVDLHTKVVINQVYKGSYNYAETGVMGFSAHEHSDVKPHREAYGFYVDPRPSFAPHKSRIFPRTDSKGRPLASFL